MTLRNEWEKMKWRAGVVKDTAANFRDRYVKGLAAQGFVIEPKRTYDAAVARINARKAARRASKPA